MKIICALCGKVIREEPERGASVSHEYCRVCADSVRRALHHNVVEFEFWQPGKKDDRAVMNILDVGAREIELQVKRGRTMRGVVRG